MTGGTTVKTNAMRALELRHVPYEAFTYDESIVSAAGVAEALDLDVEEVYKTLIMVRDDGQFVVVMVPGDREVDVKRLSRELGAKAVHMATKRDAERVTGLQTGGIGALALLQKRLPTFIDRRALDHERILVNGGRRGLNLRVRVPDLIALTGAVPVDTSVGDERV